MDYSLWMTLISQKLKDKKLNQLKIPGLQVNVINNIYDNTILYIIYKVILLIRETQDNNN